MAHSRVQRQALPLAMVNLRVFLPVFASQSVLNSLTQRFSHIVECRTLCLSRILRTYSFIHLLISCFIHSWFLRPCQWRRILGWSEMNTELERIWTERSDLIYGTVTAFVLRGSGNGRMTTVTINDLCAFIWIVTSRMRSKVVTITSLKGVIKVHYSCELYDRSSLSGDRRWRSGLQKV
jgi:hypothetical protein